MKKTLLPFLLFLSINSMAQSKATTPRQLHEGIYLVQGGEISKDYTRCQLVQIKRTMQGLKHTFISDNGDTLYRVMQRRLPVDSCYQVLNIKK